MITKTLFMRKLVVHQHSPQWIDNLWYRFVFVYLYNYCLLLCLELLQLHFDAQHGLISRCVKILTNNWLLLMSRTLTSNLSLLVGVMMIQPFPNSGLISFYLMD